MLNAAAIFRLLVEDDTPTSPDDKLDFDAEIWRHSENFRLPGSGPTTTYHRLHALLDNRRPRRLPDNPYARILRVGNNTYLIDYGNRVAVRFHETEVVTAYTDGKVVVDAGGWRTRTTLDRISTALGSSAGNWRLYRKNYKWYWFNGTNNLGNWNDTTRYPYTDGDTIFPEGSLKIQATPEHRVRRRRKLDLNP